MGGGGYIPIVSEIGDIFKEGTRAAVDATPLTWFSEELFGEETAKDIEKGLNIAYPAAAAYLGAPYAASAFGAGGTAGAAGAGGTAGTGAGTFASGTMAGWPEFEAAYATGGLGAGAGAGAGMLSGAAGMLSGLGTPLTLAGMTLGSQYLGAGAAKDLAEEQWNKQAAWQDYSYQRQKSDISEQQSYMDQAIKDAQSRATAEWQKTAFPSETAIGTAKTAGTAALAQKLMQAKQGFFEESAARGISGGAKLAGGIAGLESESLRNKAKLLSDITQFSQTPYAAPPIMTAYPSMSVPSPGGTPAMSTYTPFETQAANTIQGLTGTVGGLSTYAWLKKNYPDLFGGI